MNILGVGQFRSASLAERCDPTGCVRKIIPNLLDPVFHNLGRGEYLVGKVAMLEELEHGLDRV